MSIKNVKQYLSKQGCLYFFFCFIEVNGNISKNGRKCSYLNRVVVRNCNVMLAVLLGTQPDMAAGLPGNSIFKMF